MESTAIPAETNPAKKKTARNPKNQRKKAASAMGSSRTRKKSRSNPEEYPKPGENAKTSKSTKKENAPAHAHATNNLEVKTERRDTPITKPNPKSERVAHGNSLPAKFYASDNDASVYTVEQFRAFYMDEFDLKWAICPRWKEGDECEVYHMKAWERGKILGFRPGTLQYATMVTVYSYRLECEINGNRLRPWRPAFPDLAGDAKGVDAQTRAEKEPGRRRPSRRSKQIRLSEQMKEEPRKGEDAADENKNHLQLKYVFPAAPVSDEVLATSSNDEEQFVLDVVKNIIYFKSRNDANFLAEHVDFLGLDPAETPNYDKAYAKYMEKKHESEQNKKREVLQVIREGLAQIWDAFGSDTKELDVSKNKGVQKLAGATFVAWQKAEVMLELQESRNVVDGLARRLAARALAFPVRDQLEVAYWRCLQAGLKGVLDKHFNPLQHRLMEPLEFLSKTGQMTKEEFVSRVMESLRDFTESEAHRERMRDVANGVVAEMVLKAFDEMKIRCALREPASEMVS